jgi:hypothetical protein
MRSNSIQLNPFSLMMEPEMVLQAMERSEALRGLRQQVFHPLDKPLRFNVSADLAAFDAAVERGFEAMPMELPALGQLPARFI